jgi:hypothetical protein
MAMLIAAGAAVVLCASGAHAAASTATTGDPVVASSIAGWSSPVLPQIQAMEMAGSPLFAQALPGDEPVDVYAVKKKSPARAFIQSFLIPGWGQLYAKSAIWKPILFVGLEAGGWFGVTTHRGNGNDKEKVYRAFADDYWDPDRYINGLNETFYNGTQIENRYLDTISYTTLDDDDKLVYHSLSHHAFFKSDGSGVEKDEYYENIGKYHQFNFGWDDYPQVGSDAFPEDPSDTAHLNYVSPHRKTYINMRDEANQEFKRASTFLAATVANHLLAGFWAAIDARAYNRTQDQFSRVEPQLRLVKSPSAPGRLMPQVTMTYRFR